eukprot:1198003-Amphidinium_carterae.1
MDSGGRSVHRPRQDTCHAACMALQSAYTNHDTPKATTTSESSLPATVAYLLVALSSVCNREPGHSSPDCGCRRHGHTLEG